MLNRGIAGLATGAMVVSVMAACSGTEGPTPAELAQIRQDSIEALRARRDSLARAAALSAARDSSEAAQRSRALAAKEAARVRDILAEMVHFDYDQADLEPEARAVLIRKITVLRANPDVRLRIEGHADERGSIEYNLALGKRRAESVKEFFGVYGLDGGRFETVSFGEARPLNPAHNESAWAMNRRAEFEVTAGGERLRAPRVSPAGGR